MAAEPIVEDGDALEQRGLRLLARPEPGAADQLVLQRAEEALHWGIITGNLTSGSLRLRPSRHREDARMSRPEHHRYRNDR